MAHRISQAPRRPLALLGALALVAAGCSDHAPSPIAPSSPHPGSARFSVSGGSKHISNSQKYSDAGAKPSTGRSGSASLQVRALLGRTGGTVVEATTGALDGGAAPGKIEKAQVKLLAQGGTSATRNYNGLSGGGYWTATYPELLRNDNVQVQVNVTGIDAKRTDVVTVTAPVKRRPDPAVLSVSGPAEALPGQLVNFAAVVSELNGDVGARADCVLSVDGTAVDRAEGIWVDAGSTVSCAFSRAFPQPGTHQVSVAVTGVTPGDWDAANNSASTSLTIRTPGTPIPAGYVWVDRLDRTWADAGSNNGYYPFSYSSTGTENWSRVYFYGWQQSRIPFPLQRLDLEISTGAGQTHARTLVPNWEASWSDWYYANRCQGYQEDGEWMHACSYTSTYSGLYEHTYFYYHRMAGEVTYTGSQYYCDSYGCNTYSWNNSYGWGIRTPFQVGSQVAVKLGFVDGAGTAHTVDRSVSVQDRSSEPWVNASDSGCYYDSWRGGQTCYSHTRRGTYLQGMTNW